jgi:hypothetical protein
MVKVSDFWQSSSFFGWPCLLRLFRNLFPDTQLFFCDAWFASVGEDHPAGRNTTAKTKNIESLVCNESKLRMDIAQTFVGSEWLDTNLNITTQKTDFSSSLG